MPHPPKSTKIRIITHDIRKLTSPLVTTEMAHIQTEAARDRYRKSGCQEVEVYGEEDERRCDICGKLNGKRFQINGVMPIPAHPNCRCCLIPVVEIDT